MKKFMLKNIIAATIIVTTMITVSPTSASAAYWKKSSDMESITLLQKAIAENSVLGSNSLGESESRSSNSGKTNENTSNSNNNNNNNNGSNNANGNISNDNKESGKSELAQESSFAKNVRITSVGPVKYISIVFAEGIIDDYIYYIDEGDVTNLFTKVSTEGNVVKYELQGGEKELLLKQKSTGKKSIYIIK